MGFEFVGTQQCESKIDLREWTMRVTNWMRDVSPDPMNDMHVRHIELGLINNAQCNFGRKACALDEKHLYKLT